MSRLITRRRHRDAAPPVLPGPFGGRRLRPRGRRNRAPGVEAAEFVLPEDIALDAPREGFRGFVRALDRPMRVAVLDVEPDQAADLAVLVGHDLEQVANPGGLR